MKNILAIVVVIMAVVFLMLLGESYRAYPKLYIFIWFATPALSLINMLYAACEDPKAKSEDLLGYQIARVFLIIVAVVVSFSVFAHSQNNNEIYEWYTERKGLVTVLAFVLPFITWKCSSRAIRIEEERIEEMRRDRARETGRWSDGM
jgi:hypothetical protein